MSKDLLKLEIVNGEEALPIYYLKVCPFIYKELGTNKLVKFNNRLRGLLSGNMAGPIITVKWCLFPNYIDEDILYDYATSVEICEVLDYFEKLDNTNTKDEYLNILNSLHTDKKDKKLLRK